MRKGLKQFITFFAGLLFFSTVFAAVVQRNNSKLELYQKRMVFTSDGTATGTLIMDIGSGSEIIAYGNVGIGTTIPTQALTVSGIVKSDGTLFKSGTAALPVLADTGDVIFAQSGGRLATMYRSGGWVVSNYLTP